LIIFIVITNRQLFPIDWDNPEAQFFVFI